MTPLFRTFFRALLSQMHPRMLLMTVLPFVLALALWGLALWQGLQPLIDQLHAWFSDYGLFRQSAELLDSLGLSSLHALLVPLLAMWLLLPFMIVTALLLVGALAMPAIATHVGRHYYPQLERRHGGSFGGSLWVSLSSLIVFLLAWLVTLPLNLVPLFALIVQPLLWGWLTCRVMSYDALADFADKEELITVRTSQRFPLLVIGVATGSLGAAPGLLWLGGVMSVIFFPVLAAVAIWLYLLIFVFSGLWFQHYCLDALARLRGTFTASIDPDRVIDAGPADEIRAVARDDRHQEK
jgi:uncharacterized protein involved in cysteine biosynthesis